MILPKYNYKFVFENDIDIPVDEKLVYQNKLNKQSFVKNFVASVMSQMYGASKVVYKYYQNDFYLDIFLEQNKTGILFIDNAQMISEQELEVVRDICKVLKIRLITVRLYGREREDALRIQNEIVLPVTQNEPIENIDKKTMSILLAIGECLKVSKFEKYIEEKVDTYLCYKLAILLSLEKRTDDDAKKIWT